MRPSSSPIVAVLGLVALVAAAMPHTLLAAFPKPAGRINDFAGILDTATTTQVAAIIREAERLTSAEIAVATVTSLDGMSVEEYANRLFHEWGVGKKNRDNGILLLVAPHERKVRIEVGYGLEPVLPDGLAGEIIRTDVLPLFRQNDYARGTLRAVTHIAAIVQRGHVLTADERRLLEQPNQDVPWIWITCFLAVFVGIGAFMVGSGLKSKTVFPVVFGAIFGGAPLVVTIIAKTPGMILAPFAILVGIASYRRSRTTAWRTSSRRGSLADTGGWVMGDSTSSGDGSSSSDSGGSFGGGDSGGGGASGSW